MTVKLSPKKSKEKIDQNVCELKRNVKIYSTGKGAFTVGEPLKVPFSLRDGKRTSTDGADVGTEKK